MLVKQRVGDDLNQQHFEIQAIARLFVEFHILTR